MSQDCYLTMERLRQVLRYEPETGNFIWLVTLSNRCPAGKIAGAPSIKDGWVIRIDTHLHKAHRLAWLYMTGQWPKLQIDHKDLDKRNNRWDNLREATNAQNNANKRVRANNQTGVKGVIWSESSTHRPYEARITIGGKVRILGYFAKVEDARAAYKAAAIKEFGEFARWQ